jgi:hypothetical protein
MVSKMSKYPKLEKINKKFKALQEEKNKEQEKIAKILIPKFKKDLVGKCYKYKSSDGSFKESWYYYIKITGISDVNFYNDSEPEPSLECFSFELTSDNRFSVEMKAHRYRLDKDYEEIPCHEFDNAYLNHIKIVNKQALSL